MSAAPLSAVGRVYSKYSAPASYLYTSDEMSRTLLSQEPSTQKPKSTRVAPASQSESVWTTREILLLTGITLLAGVLRLLGIGEWSFWIDEAHTLRDAVVKPLHEFWAEPTARYPLSYLMLRFVHPLLPGSQEGSYRLLFAFFGIASIPLLAVSARSFIGSAPALIAALILTLSPWHIYWSQNCRFYALALFFCLAAMATFRLGVERLERKWFLGSAFLVVLAILCHPTSFLLLAALLVFLLLMRRRPRRWPEALDRRLLAWFFVPLGVAFLVSLAMGVDAIEAVMTFSKAKGGGTLFHLMSTTVFHLRVPLVVAGIFGAAMFWRRRERGGLLLISVAFVPLLGLALISPIAKPTAQYLYFSLPAWAALAAYGLWEVTSEIRPGGKTRFLARWLPLAILLLDLMAQDYLYFRYRHGNRPMWREAADYVIDHGNNDDIIGSTNQPSMEWYLNPNHPVLGRDSRGDRKVGLVAEWTMSDLKSWVHEADRRKINVWVVITEPEFEEMAKVSPDNEYLRNTYHQVKSFKNWNGPKDMTILVYLYRGR